MDLTQISLLLTILRQYFYIHDNDNARIPFAKLIQIWVVLFKSAIEEIEFCTD